MFIFLILNRRIYTTSVIIAEKGTSVKRKNDFSAFLSVAGNGFFVFKDHVVNILLRIIVFHVDSPFKIKNSWPLYGLLWEKCAAFG
jgi:hypothetical protein